MSAPDTLLHEAFLDISQRESVSSEFEITSLPTELPYALDEDRQAVEVEKLSHALEELSRIDARLAECVDLEFFCGFSFVEIAKMREVSERTVQRDWDKARFVLNRLIKEQENPSDSSG